MKRMDPVVDDRMIFMRFRPMWAYIDGIREFCRFFCATTFVDSAVADRVQLVIQELLENAIKYSASSEICDVELELTREPEHVVVGVLNYATPEATQKLEEEFNTLCAMEPEAAYMFAFERASRSESGSNRMGLARIRHEGQVSIELTQGGDGRIRISARGKI